MELFLPQPVSTCHKLFLSMFSIAMINIITKSNSVKKGFQMTPISLSQSVMEGIQGRNSDRNLEAGTGS